MGNVILLWGHWGRQKGTSICFGVTGAGSRGSGPSPPLTLQACEVLQRLFAGKRDIYLSHSRHHGATPRDSEVPAEDVPCLFSRHTPSQHSSASQGEDHISISGFTQAEDILQVGK